MWAQVAGASGTGLYAANSHLLREPRSTLPLSCADAHTSPLRPAVAGTAPALAATALLLTGCGTERADAGSPDAGAAEPPSRTQADDPGKDGVRIT
ncbi:hypothetical protein [Streptomyces sp. NPDC059814]|uniref:hypothetical protein n=1 Tax=Streptomyces sp. NPDC059814 TaxID=3346959 RepID=UPI003656D6FB